MQSLEYNHSTMLWLFFWTFLKLTAFAIPISENSIITWGIPVGIFVILLSFLLTGVYAYRANTEFDRLTKDIIEHAKNIHDK